MDKKSHRINVQPDNEITASRTIDNLVVKQPKLKAKPYVTFALTQACPFKCIYCGDGGEVTISSKKDFDIDSLERAVDISMQEGVEKFRLTGGEPFSYRNISRAINYVLNKGAYLLVNTNGLLVDRHLGKFASSGNLRNLHIAVSLDTVNEETFDKMSSTRGFYKRVMGNIEMLRRMNLLMRINMVVTKLNADEIGQMIDFCNQLGVDLKLQEVSSVPSPYNQWADLHYPLELAEPALNGMANTAYLHDYSKSYGIPVKIFKIGTTMVTLKSLHQGSSYNVDDLCRSCEYFPCHEGLYDIQVLPDLRIATCRWNAFGDGKIENFGEYLRTAIKVFALAQHIPKSEILKPMEPLSPAKGMGLLIVPYTRPP